MAGGSTGNRRRWPARVAWLSAALGVAAAASPVAAGASAPAAAPAAVAVAAAKAATTTVAPTNAYFIGAGGSLYGFGRTSDGKWSAAAVAGTVVSAPAGAPVASARFADGTPVVFVVGNDGAIHGGCDAGLSLTPPGWLKPGAPLAVALTSMPVMVFYSDSLGGMTGVHTESEIHHPCDVQAAPPPPPPPPPTEVLPGAWHVPGGTAAAIGLANGEIGVFAVDVNGAVHASWRDVAGTWTDVQLTAAGTSRPGGGIAVTSSAGGGLSLFYPNHTGQVVLASVVAGGGLVGPPQPDPWPVAGVPDGAALGAAGSSLGVDVAYAATDGTVEDLQADSVGHWKAAVTLSATGFAVAGSLVAVTEGADEVDVYCGTSAGAPGHFRVPPHVSGGVTWTAAGASGLLPKPGGITAS